MITGNDLLNLGYKPSKLFGQILKYSNENNLNIEQIKEYADSITPVNIQIEPFENPISYKINLETENELEISNLNSVIATMDVLMKTPTVINGVIMPDACPTGEVGQIPVGGVVATKNAIHPAMHSEDVCCSVMLSNIGIIDPKLVLDIAQQVTHFGYGGRTDGLFILPQELLEKIKANKFLKDEKSVSIAKNALGTQGDGNHFLYVGLSSNTKETCIVTHCGSRAFGAELFKKGMIVAEKYRTQLSPKTIQRNAWIPYDTEDGKEYWNALQIVREWTKLNHMLIHDEIIKRLNASLNNRFWNEHNFVFKDNDIFYHAKGATPLDDKFVPDSVNGLRIIPLNMSQPILIVRGTTTENNLGFAPHGAGRNVSRSEHTRSKIGKTVEEIFNEETVGLDIRFFTGNIDISELPSAYKNVESVQQQIEKFNLGEIVNKIMPYGCIMAGDTKKRFELEKIII